MLKEQIFEKMNGFLTEELLLLPEQHIIEDEFAEGKECCLLYEGIFRQRGIFVSVLGKMRMKMWRLF